jgi:hypothetical protein
LKNPYFTASSGKFRRSKKHKYDDERPDPSLLPNMTGLADAPLRVVVPHTNLIDETMTETVKKIMI